jgi:hypothetical protein
MADDPNDGFQGQKELATGNSPFNQLSFLIKMATSKMNVAMLVQVVAVYPGAGSPDECGTVDVLPLVNLVDGAGSVWPHTTLFGIPYFRLQGGVAAVIVDPVVGDLGMAVFCDKDISSVKATFQASAPASERRFDMADGFYFGGWMPTVEPTTYVQILPTGTINIVTPSNSVVLSPASITSTMGSTTVVQTGSNVTVTGTTKVVGTLEVTGGVTLDSTLLVSGATNVSTLAASGTISQGSHTLVSHTHGGVQPGGGNTGGPNG